MKGVMRLQKALSRCHECRLGGEERQVLLGLWRVQCVNRGGGVGATKGGAVSSVIVKMQVALLSVRMRLLTLTV